MEECNIMNSKPVALILIIAASLFMFSCQKEMSDYEKSKADFLENAKRIESALQEVHPDLKSLGYTEVKNVSYEIRGGGDIQYYFCKTTYFDEIPKLNGVHLEAVQSVVDIDNAEDSKETKILEYDAIIYTLNEREYLCWTISPEISCILEYTPCTVSDEDIRLMAESVQ